MANRDIAGNLIQGEIANQQHINIHRALDVAGFPRGEERGDFLNSLDI